MISLKDFKDIFPIKIQFIFISSQEFYFFIKVLRLCFFSSQTNADEVGEDCDEEDYESEETPLESYETPLDRDETEVDEYQVFKNVLQSK